MRWPIMTSLVLAHLWHDPKKKMKKKKKRG
jgi:hypothetical protein